MYILKRVSYLLTCIDILYSRLCFHFYLAYGNRLLPFNKLPSNLNHTDHQTAKPQIYLDKTRSTTTVKPTIPANKEPHPSSSSLPRNSSKTNVPKMSVTVKTSVESSTSPSTSEKPIILSSTVSTATKTTVGSSGKGPRYDNSTTHDHLEPTEPTTVSSIDSEVTTIDANGPGDISTQHVFIIQTRPNGTNEMRIDMFGPTLKTTTMPPSTKEENNARRPTTRIDISLEDGFDFPSTTIGPIPPAEDDSRPSTSSTSYKVLSTTQTVSRTDSTPFPPIVENDLVCNGGKSDCPYDFHCIAGRCQLGNPKNQLKPTTLIATKSCNSNDDCDPKQRCVSSRCLTSCTTLTSNTTTINPVDCFQGTTTLIRHSF